MKKIKETICSLLAIVIIAGISFGGGFWYCNQRAEKRAEEVVDTTPDVKLPGEVEKRIVTIDEVETKLVEIGELSTYSGEYAVTKEADYSRYFIDEIKIWGTENTVHLECEGIVKVGYDVHEIGVNIDNGSYTIYISLPEATVNDNYVIWDTVKCTEKNNLFNPIDFDQYQTLIDEIEAEGLAQAEEKGIYSAAEENVKSIIINFLSGMNEYEVKFI